MSDAKRRGTGRIFRRKDTAFLWCAYYLRGKEFRESTNETDEKKAWKFLERRLNEIGADKIGAKTFIGPQQERVTVNDLLDSLERDFKLRSKWNGKVRSNMKPIREHFGDRHAIEVTSDAVCQYIEQSLEKGYTPATINRRTTLLGQAYRLAQRAKKLSAAPYIQRLSEIGNERQGFFEKESFEEVVKHLPEYLRDFVHFDFLIGWRKSSMQSLRWSDVTDDVIILRAVNSKTRKPESVPLEGELQEIIERRRAAAVWQTEDGETHFSEYVFHQNGHSIGDFRKAWARACCAAGVGKLVCRACEGDIDAARNCLKCGRTWRREELKYIGALFHDFRRTAARNLVRGGVSPNVAMKITGHRTDSMFRRYAIVDEDQKRDALAKLQHYLAATSKRKK